jgi:pyruvate formate lyase activating enzyme
LRLIPRLRKNKMKIGGLQKVSLIDYPGLICSIVFVQGCNFKCSYCHNPELVEPKLFQPLIGEQDVFDFLSIRKGKIDAVSISGGEPSIQKELLPFIQQVKKMGFAVKLDTNGSQPQVIRSLLEDNLLDFIAMDVKGPAAKYRNIACVPIDPEKIQESIENILQSKVEHEFRTTIVKSQLTEKNILEIGKMILGARKYVLQKFIPDRTLAKQFAHEKTYSEEELQKFKKRLEKEIPFVIVR